MTVISRNTTPAPKSELNFYFKESTRLSQEKIDCLYRFIILGQDTLKMFGG